jgi:hypothetical protein
MNNDGYGFQPAEVSTLVVDGHTTRMNASDLLPSSENEAGILATARNQVGGPAGKLNDNAVVKYQGTEMTLRTASQLGLVQRDSSGNYSERGAEQRPTPTQPPADQAAGEGGDDADVEPFDAATEQASAEFAAQVPAHLHDGLISAFIGDALSGDSAASARALVEASKVAGMDIRVGTSALVSQFQAQADALLTKHGADPQQAYAWMRQHRSEELANAVRQQVYGRKLGAWKPLIDSFLNSNSPSMDAVKHGGFETKTEGGIDMVNVDGQWMAITTAARLGWL